MLEVINVDKFYGGVKAVENVSLEVGKGKIIGLIEVILDVFCGKCMIP